MIPSRRRYWHEICLPKPLFEVRARIESMATGLELTLLVLATVGSVMAVGYLGHRYLLDRFDISLAGAFALGGALAMSSTAIVLKLLAERMELETEHGKRIVGVLLFQDLAVVPLLVIVPA